MAVKYGAYALALNAFIEAIFFPIPPDVLLITLCALEPERSFFYALVATLASSLGGVAGYFLGRYGGRPIALKFFGREKLSKVEKIYKDYEEVAIVLAGFTPLPYKLFTVSSGVLSASLWKLFIFSIVGRGLRFFTEGALFFFFGEEIKEFVGTNLNLIFAALGILVILALFIAARRQEVKESGNNGV